MTSLLRSSIAGFGLSASNSSPTNSPRGGVYNNIYSKNKNILKILREINHIITIHNLEELKEYIPESFMLIIDKPTFVLFGGCQPITSIYSTQTSFSLSKEHSLHEIVNIVKNLVDITDPGTMTNVSNHVDLKEYSEKNKIKYNFLLDSDSFIFMLLGYDCARKEDEGLLNLINMYFVPFISKILQKKMNQSYSNIIPIISTHMNPSLQGLLDITKLLSTTKLTKDQKKYVSKIKECNLEMLSVLNDMTDYYRFATTNTSISKTDFYFPSICQEAYDIVYNRLQKNGNVFNYKINHKVPFVFHSDQRKIVLLVINSILFLNSHICDATISLHVNYDSDKELLKLIFGIANGHTYEKLQKIISRAAAIDLVLFMTKSFSNALAFKLLDIFKGTIELEIPEKTDELCNTTNVVMSLPLAKTNESIEKHIITLMAMKLFRNYNWTICTNKKSSHTYNEITSLLKEYDSDFNTIEGISQFGEMKKVDLQKNNCKQKKNQNVLIVDIDHISDVKQYNSLRDINKYLHTYNECIVCVLYISEKKRKFKKQSSLLSLNTATSRSSKKYILRTLLKQLHYTHYTKI